MQLRRHKRNGKKMNGWWPETAPFLNISLLSSLEMFERDEAGGRHMDKPSLENQNRRKCGTRPTSWTRGLFLETKTQISLGEEAETFKYVDEKRQKP